MNEKIKTIIQCQNIKAKSFYIWNVKLIKGKGEGKNTCSLNPWILEQNVDFRTNKNKLFTPVDYNVWGSLSPYFVKSRWNILNMIKMEKQLDIWAIIAYWMNIRIT